MLNICGARAGARGLRHGAGAHARGSGPVYIQGQSAFYGMYLKGRALCCLLPKGIYFFTGTCLKGGNAFKGDGTGPNKRFTSGPESVHQQKRPFTAAISTCGKVSPNLLCPCFFDCKQQHRLTQTLIKYTSPGPPGALQFVHEAPKMPPRMLRTAPGPPQEPQDHPQAGPKRLQDSFKRLQHRLTKHHRKIEVSRPSGRTREGPHLIPTPPHYPRDPHGGV